MQTPEGMKPLDHIRYLLGRMSDQDKVEGLMYLLGRMSAKGMEEGLLYLHSKMISRENKEWESQVADFTARMEGPPSAKL